MKATRIRQSADGRFSLIVPADTNPLVGSDDVEVPAASGGPLTLRCNYENWLEPPNFNPKMRAGFLAPEIADRVRRKRAEIEAGASTESLLARQVDDDPEYEDWKGVLSQAQTTLVEAVTRDRIHLGVADATSSEHLGLQLDYRQAAALARSAVIGPGNVDWLRYSHQSSSHALMGLPPTVDAADLAQTGWVVVFHGAESQAVRDALGPLIEHRRAQAGSEKTKVLEVQSGDDCWEWLARHGVAAGDAEPAKVPYYVFLVGPPTRIPFAFQSLLAVDYAGQLELAGVEKDFIIASRVAQRRRLTKAEAEKLRELEVAKSWAAARAQAAQRLKLALSMAVLLLIVAGGAGAARGHDVPTASVAPLPTVLRLALQTGKPGLITNRIGERQ